MKIEDDRLDGPQRGKFFGCLAAFLLAISVGFVMLFGLFWGGAHCDPVPQCQRANESHFFVEALILLAACAVVGFAIRYLTAFVSRRLDAQPVLATLINMAAVLLAIWIGFQGTMELLLMI